MSSLPTQIVEIAFTGGDSAPVWTDISAYVMRLSTTRGRTHVIDKFNAGTLQLELDNRTRRFDPEYVAGPYYGQLLPMKPIRVRATWNGVTYPIFRGHVDQFPQTYQIPNVARTNVTATDGFKRKQRVFLLPPYDQQVTSVAPTHWYKLGDPAGTSLPVDSAASALQPAQVVGTGVTFGSTAFMPGSSSTSALFSGFGSAVVVPSAALPQLASFTVEMWFQIANGTNQPANPGNAGVGMILNLGGTGGSPELQVSITNTNLLNAFLFFGAFPDTGFSSAAAVNDGKAHQVIITVDGPNHRYTVYLDGVSLGTETPSSFVATAPYFGALAGYIGNRTGYDVAFNGNMQDVTFYDGVILTGTQITNLYNAGGNGFSGELTGTRLNRLLDWAGWDANLRNVDAGKQACGPMQASQGKTSVLLVEQNIEDTEVGALYMSADGKATFRSRWGVLQDSRSVTSQATFGDAAGELPYADITFSFDDQLLRNVVYGTRNGGAEQSATDATSVASYGTVTYVRSTTQELDDYSVLYTCQHEVLERKDVLTRVESLVVNGEASANGKGPNDIYPQSLGREIGDRITVNRRPQSVGPVVSKQVLIEGVKHDADASKWVTTFMLSPIPQGSKGGTTPFLILDDATYGKVGSGRLGF